MTVYGLSGTGFAVKPVSAVLSDLQIAAQSAFGAAVDYSPESVLGNLFAMVATQLGAAWEALGAAYAARDPDNATSSALDAVAALTGTTRSTGTFGSVALTWSVAAFSTVPAGTIAQNTNDATIQWITSEDAVNSTGSTAPVIVPATCTQRGQFFAPAGTIKIIATPVAGALSVINASDAAAGAPPDNDAALRLRRESELSRTGDGGPLEAIRSTLLELQFEGELILAACFVDENSTDATDYLGRPPHTVQVVIQFGSWVSARSTQDQNAITALVAATLWLCKPSGNAYTGSTTLTTLDSQGITRTVEMTLATGVPVYVSITIRVDTTYVGDSVVSAAIVAYGATLVMGASVIIEKIRGAAITQQGVDDVLACTISTDNVDFVPVNIAMGNLQVATIDISNVAIIHG